MENSGLSKDTHIRNTEAKHGTKLACRIVSFFGVLLLAAYIVLLPKYIEPRLEKNAYREWLEHKTEPYSGIVMVWHIVDFKPYIGSLGAWLTLRANEYAGDLIGVFFEVETYTEDEANEQLARGRSPDIISFAHGTQQAGTFLELTSQNDAAPEYAFDVSSGAYRGAQYAIPFCASGELLVYNPTACAGMTYDEISAVQGTMDEFKRGKALSCIADARAVGDLYRAGLVGEQISFDAVPAKGANTLVQYVGVCKGIDDEKLPYAMGFITHIVSMTSQSKLCGLGLVPLNPQATKAYEMPWLIELAKQFDLREVPCCFDYFGGDA